MKFVMLAIKMDYKNNIKNNLNRSNYKAKIGLITGIVLFFIILFFFPVPESFTNTFSSEITGNNTIEIEMNLSFKSVLALLVLMIVWWVTEAIPIPATSLLPAVLLPIMQVKGITSGEIYNFNFINSLKNYAHPVIGMFLGSFLIASAFQKYELDKRATIWILTRGKITKNTKVAILTLMYGSAFLSMWISNTATVAIVLPIALGIIHSIKNVDVNFNSAILLGLAWSASVGGIATIVGTPPNGIAISLLASHNIRTIDFLDWMKIGLPFMIFFIPVIWFVLLKFFKFSDETIIDQEYLNTLLQNIGKIKRSELIVLMLFLITVFLWISNPFWENFLPIQFYNQIKWIDEYMIGLVGGVALFVVPISFKKLEFVLNWKDTRNIDWGTLILFGGGLTLSDAMFKTGLAAWIAKTFLGVFGNPTTLVLLFLTVLFIVFLTEVTSNTAVTAMMVPVLIAISSTSGQDTTTLVIGAAIAASMAFMLPVATPPNALVYGTGYVKLSDMIRVGLILEILGWIYTISILFVFGNLIFNIIKF